MPTFPAGFLEMVLGEATGGPPLPHSDLVLELERVEPGCVFAAGEFEAPGRPTVDGYADIPMAIARGATGIIYRPRPGRRTVEGARAWQVGDVVQAYRLVAEAWRRRHPVPAIAIGGAAGKTTTKEWVAAVLAGRYRVHRTPGNRNGFAGTPETLLGLEATHELAVVEIGIDAVNAMKSHAELVDPAMALLTSLGPEHLDGLGDLETAVREEGELFTYVAARRGTLFVNLDDPLVMDVAARVRGGRRIGYTLGGDAGIGAAVGCESVWRGAVDGGRILVTSDVPFAITPPLPGRHNATNALAAAVVGRTLGVTPWTIADSLAGARAIEGRCEIRSRACVEFICDHYNANPVSAAASIELLAARRDALGGRAWACLGDMEELGREVRQAHAALARQLVRLRIDHVLALGPAMRTAADEADRRADGPVFRHVSSQAHARDILLSELVPNDVVLIKGSRRAGLETLSRMLTAESSRTA